MIDMVFMVTTDKYIDISLTTEEYIDISDLSLYTSSNIFISDVDSFIQFCKWYNEVLHASY